jgi:uncharacterized protein involved in exopolysaccharide biosynthesis/Mrp family chromosome partitioning ATPase
MAGEDERAPMDLKRLLIIMRRRLLWIIQALVVIPCGTAYFMNQMPNVYQATAKLLIEPRDMQQSIIGDLSPAAQSAWVDELTILKTQTQLFNTKAFADRVMGQLQKTSPDDRSLWSLGSLTGRLRATLLEETRIIEVACEDTDPVRAARIVNAGSEVFVQEAARHNRSNAEKARQFVEDQLRMTKNRLADIENHATEFKEANGIFSLTSQMDALIQRRATLEGESEKTNSDLRQLHAQQDAIRQRLTLSTSEVRDLTRIANDPELSTLRGQRLDLQSKLWTIGKEGAESQQAAFIRRQIEQLDRAVSSKVAVILGKKANTAIAGRLALLDSVEQELARQLITTEIQAASLQEAHLVSSGAKVIVEEQLRKYPAKERQLSTYVRELGSLGENYKTLSGKLEELRIAESAKISPVSIIEPAIPNTAPIRPNKSRSLLSSVFVGLAVGVVLALLVDSLDETVWSKEELAYLFAGLPVLAEFPPMKIDADAFDPLHWREAANLSDTDVAMLDVCRSLRTNLSFLTPAASQRLVLALVNAGRDDLRPKIVFSLAASYALTDKSVCIVDADLRHPTLHLETGLANDQGLSDVLTGLVPLGSVLKSTGWPNLSIITAGSPALMPTELLERAAFAQSIRHLQEKFDVVVIHAPEADTIDALVTATVADQVLLGVRLETDRRSRLAELREQFALPNLNVKGLVCWRSSRGLAGSAYRRSRGAGLSS